MSNIAGTEGEDVLKFDAINAEIFKIPDIATRLATLQGYFFLGRFLLATAVAMSTRQMPLSNKSRRWRRQHRFGFEGEPAILVDVSTGRAGAPLMPQPSRRRTSFNDL